MKRFLLITCVLCILTASLAVSSRTVHAQARTDLVSQHTTVVNDQPSYPFWADGWGWGYCLSHSDLQTADSNTNFVRNAFTGFLSVKFGPASYAAWFTIEGYYWYMHHID